MNRMQEPTLEGRIEFFIKHVRTGSEEDVRKELGKILDLALGPPSGRTHRFSAADSCADKGGFEDAVEEAADRVVKAVGICERGSREPCWTERVNVVAYLAHRLRLHPWMIDRIKAIAARFSVGQR